MDEKLGVYKYTQNSVRLTGDTLALASFVRVRKHDRVCDLGCGAGAVILLLLSREKDLLPHGVELLPGVCADALRNMRQNGLCVPITNADWRDFARDNAESFDAAVSNPPYYDRECGAVSPERERSYARTGDEDTLPSLCSSAHKLLKNGGRFTLCYPSAQLVTLMLCLRENGMEPKRLMLKGKLACVEAKKGGRPGLEVIA